MPVTRARPKSNESIESSASNETTHRGGNVSSVSSRGQGLLRSSGPAVGLRSGTSATDDLDVQSKLRVNEPGDKYEKEAENPFAGEVEADATLESVIALSGGDTTLSYRVMKDGKQVGVLDMQHLVQALVPTSASEEGMRAQAV